jgi:hypothetical protein
VQILFLAVVAQLIARPIAIGIVDNQLFKVF